MKKDDKELVNLDDIMIERTPLEDAEGEYERFLEVFEEVKGDIETLVTEENRHLHQVNEELRREVEARRRLERRVQTQLDFLEVFMDAVPMPLGFTDESGRYVGMNQSFLDYFSLTRLEAIGKPLGSLYSMRPKPQTANEYETRTGSGETRLVLRYEAPYSSTKNEPKGSVEVLADITEFRMMQLQQEEQEQLLIQQSKMAAMGEMIGNISKQWRRPLQALTEVIEEVEEGHAKKNLNRGSIRDLIDRGTRLTTRMSETIDEFRNFFQPRKNPTRFTLAEVVANTRELLHASLLDCGIDITEEGDREAAIFGYKNEFSQVALNIMHNAKDIIEERGIHPGHIHIVYGREDGQVFLSIRDNGGGIEEKVLPRIFDPYFTTKSDLAGTGVGLYMAHTIIEVNMGGRIEAENCENGACFTVRVPAAD